MAPPFRQAEFDIIYGEGISWEGSVLDVGLEKSIIQKSGSYFSFAEERLGQGRANATAFLVEHPDTLAAILALIAKAEAWGSAGRRWLRPPRPPTTPMRRPTTSVSRRWPSRTACRRATSTGSARADCHGAPPRSPHDGRGQPPPGFWSRSTGQTGWCWRRLTCCGSGCMRGWRWTTRWPRRRPPRPGSPTRRAGRLLSHRPRLAGGAGAPARADGRRRDRGRRDGAARAAGGGGRRGVRAGAGRRATAARLRPRRDPPPAGRARGGRGAGGGGRRRPRRRRRAGGRRAAR